MTIPDSPKTPKADYAVMDPCMNMNTQSSLPSTNDLQSVPPTTKESCSPLRKLARWWIALRWQLARNLFSVPLPFLTSVFDVKLGDLFIVFPICLVFIITTAIQANDREVESTGNPPTYGLLVVFILTVRNNSVLLALTGISYERVLFYHKIAALITIILSGLHGFAYILAHDKGEISGEGDMVLTGTVAFGAMVLMFVFSLGFVRRRFFEFFLRTHWILFIVVLVFAVIHGASTALIGIIPWGIDMAFRHAYRPRVYAQGSIIGGNKSTSQDSANFTGKSMGVIARDQVAMSALPGNVVRIQFPRVRKDTGQVFNYQAGQYVFLCVPTISSLEWHPFTISSSPHEPMVTLHIKALGDWTSKLQSLIVALGGEVASPFDVLVDGPYGSVSIDIKTPTTYSHFALFSGGIGVTPMRSVVNRLHYEAHHEGRSSIERVHFVWSVRNRDMAQSLVVDVTGDNRGDCYFPNGIINNVGDAFSSEIYLSRSERDVEAADLDRHLGSSLRYGSRPDISATLRMVGEQAKQNGKTRVAVLVCGPSINANIPTIDHDEVQPFEEMEPTTDSEKSAIKYKPQLHISDGCHPYPVVQADGSVSAGLKWSGRYRSGCKGSDLGSQVYSRSAWYKGKWAIMYAWYFPKGANPVSVFGSGHRHYWLHAIVWTDSPNPDNSTILGASMAGTTNNEKTSTVKSKYLANGTSLKLDSFVGLWTGIQALRLTKKSGETQDLITWEQLTDEARDALSDFSFESSESREWVVMPLRDSAFKVLLKNSYPFR
ncbi:hypothetical protein PPTG_22174 [Phytophthora nicotianae INRA-310]|uniref:FAD-binding FR-type domain-containing protein n=1 Tax=Phytophthora nicotianae (strain INRA-310) TaxID=761204 RepID=W2QQW8_PHYN3|nr:hypothetical protein PPTG_22174 [Phytophthora nicotianae INRA-310]ETN14655.1 hypothetical protein PPTG_22174 [Phytophthora nicotianae INRA-310]